MTTFVYGIKNCDTVKKALKWLDAHHLQSTLHDYREDGVDLAWLEKMEAQFGWETLLNKRSTTWRNLDDATKNALNRETALALLGAQPTLIKRPIVIKNDVALIGFDEKAYQVLME